jgi:hypothetical protein
MRGCYWIASILLLVTLTLLLAGTASAQAPAICDVRAVNVGNTSATITWTTSVLANSTVNYGNTTALGLTASDSANVTAHSIALTNLTPATLYYYEVVSSSGIGNTTVDNNCGNYYTFTTFSQSIQLEGWAWYSYTGYLVPATFDGFVTLVDRTHAGNSSSLHVVGNLTLEMINAGGNETVELDMYGNRVRSLVYLGQEVTGKSANFAGTWIDAGNSTYYVGISGVLSLPNPGGDKFKTARVCFVVLRTSCVDVPLVAPGGSFAQNLDAIITRLADLLNTFLDWMAGGLATTVSKILFQLTKIVAALRGALGTTYIL